jgi:DNA polymerase epsilon subunit 2
MMDASALQKRVLKELRFCGLSVRPDALRELVTVLMVETDQSGSLELLLKEIKAVASAGSAIEVATVRKVVSELSRADEEAAHEAALVVGAFSMPSFKYNASRAQFYRVEFSRCSAKMAAGALRDRYALVMQRLLRHPVFAPPLAGMQLGGDAGAGGSKEAARRRVKASRGEQRHCELTAIESLTASPGPRVVLGLVSRLGDGRLCLDDLNGRVPVDLREASYGAGLITEGCIVLAEGQLQDGVFVPTNVYFPPAEPREQSRAAHGGLDFVREGAAARSREQLEQLAAVEATDPGACLVFLSEVHLDDPHTLRALERALDGFAAMSPAPSTIVLLGAFTAAPVGEAEGQVSASSFSALMGQLGALLGRFLAGPLRESHVLLVPGPGDPGGAGVLPRPPLPLALAQPLLDAVLRAAEPPHGTAQAAPGGSSACASGASNVLLCTNPCRVLHLSQELVVVREDLARKMRRHCVLDPEAARGAQRLGPGEHVARTLLDQAHLAPLPPAVRPVAWAHDAALRLYPAPHALVAADSYEPYSVLHQGSQVFNPGSFADGHSFAFYTPVDRAVHFSRLQAAPEDGDMDA